MAHGTWLMNSVTKSAARSKRNASESWYANTTERTADRHLPSSDCVAYGQRTKSVGTVALGGTPLANASWSQSNPRRAISDTRR
jgi:hypothetical protein